MEFFAGGLSFDSFPHKNWLAKKIASNLDVRRNQYYFFSQMGIFYSLCWGWDNKV